MKETSRFTTLKKGFVLTLICSLQIISAQNVGINANGAAPNSKALLDIDVSGSSNKAGILVPRMTTTERNSITAPIPEALLIYNTTTQCFEAWNPGVNSWVQFGCIGGCTVPLPPTANTATNISDSGFTANWSVIPNATYYLLDVSTSSAFSSFVSGYNGLNVGNALTFQINGINCGMTYYYRLRAGNSCGVSAYSATTAVATSTCPVSCGTQVWATANLNVGTLTSFSVTSTNNGITEKHCYNDLPANCITFGAMYEWNEAMNYTTSVNCDPCGSSGRQGICPTGYHIPTDLEWSRYEYCLESSVAPTGATSLATFQSTNGWRGTATAGVGPGSKIKATASNSPPWNGTNTSGFAALPGGYIAPGGWYSLGTWTKYWTATQVSSIAVYSRNLNNANPYEIFRSTADQKTTDANYIRCLRD